MQIVTVRGESGGPSAFILEVDILSNLSNKPLKAFYILFSVAYEGMNSL